MDTKPKSYRGANIDFDQFRLRSFLERLVGTDELEVVTDRVEYGDIANRLHGNEKAVWFKNAGADGQELVGNVVASRSRMALALGVSPADVTVEIQRRLAGTATLVEVERSEAPVQEVVLTGDDADLTKLPVHVQHAMDGGPYISASIDYVIDPKSGATNSGMRRLMVRGSKTAGADLIAPSDLRIIYQASVARGEKLPVAFVVGSHPIDAISATLKIPGDELELVAKLRDAPMPVVKCITSDIRVPADAEYVLEGYFDEKGYVEKEGPYGEYLGYYGVVKQNPVFHLTAITRRSDAVFQTATISGNRLDLTDTSNLISVRTEVGVWEALKGVVREATAVYSPGGAGNVRIAMKVRYPGEARTAIYAVLAATSAKNVWVVDPDIDVFSDQQMDWAMATRFQVDRSLVAMSGMRASPLDPSLLGQSTGSKAGFDLTWPLSAQSRWELQTPAPPSFEGKRYPSMRAALEDGPKRFEELMAASGTRDGRETARELDTFRDKGLERDEMGRYSLKK